LRARAKKLQAVKIGRNWVTTKEWLNEYTGGIEKFKNGKQVLPPENLPIEIDRAVLEAAFRISVLKRGVAVALSLLIVVSSVAFGKEFSQGFDFGVRNAAIGISSLVQQFGQGLDNGVNEFSNGFDNGLPVFSKNVVRLSESFAKATFDVAKGFAQGFDYGVSSPATVADFAQNIPGNTVQGYLKLNAFVEQGLLADAHGVENIYTNANNAVRQGLFYDARSLAQGYKNTEKITGDTIVSLREMSRRGTKTVVSFWEMSRRDTVNLGNAIASRLIKSFEFAVSPWKPQNVAVQQKEIVKEEPAREIVREYRREYVTVDNAQLADLRAQMIGVLQVSGDIQSLKQITAKLQSSPPLSSAVNAPIYIGSTGVQVAGNGSFGSVGASTAGFSNLGVGGSATIGNANDSSSKFTVVSESTFNAPVAIKSSLTVGTSTLTVDKTGNLQTTGTIKVVDSNSDTKVTLDNSGNITIGGTIFQTGSSSAQFTSLIVTNNGSLNVTGSATLGDSSSDAIVFNASTISIPNNLNFASNTLFIDSSNSRVGIGTITPQTKLHVSLADSATNAISNVFTIDHTSTLTPAAGFGSAILFRLANVGGVINNAAQIAASLTTATSGSEASALTFYTGTGGAAPSEQWRITGSGVLQSIGAQTIQTATGNLTLATGAGNGNIALTPNGTGVLQFTSGVVTGTTTTSAFVMNGSALTSGTLLYLTSTNTSGTIVNLAYGAAKTLGGALTGQALDLSTNVTATDQSITGISLTANPAVTNVAVSAKTYKGLVISSGAVTQTTLAGTNTFSGVDITSPNITQTAGTITSNGVIVTTGTITTGGTQNGINIAGQGVGAGSLNGIFISAITASGGTEYAINIGAGWDRGISLGANSIVGTTGVIDYTNFDVDANGNITVQAGQGIDVNAAGILAVGNVTATTVNIGNTAATTLALGAGGALARTINIGTGTGADAINIGTGATGADTINVGSSASTTAVNVTTGTGAQTHTSSVVLGTTTTSAFVFTDNALTTGTGIYLNSSSLTTGNLFSIASTSSTGSSGKLANIDQTATYTTAVTNSGNLLNLNRALTINAAATTLTVSGAVVAIADNCTQTTGTCTNTANILSLTQSYASASGPVLAISNSGTGADISGTSATWTISKAGLITTADDIAVNGGDITTSAATFNLVNAATTLNIGSTAVTRTINIGTGTNADTIHIGEGGTNANTITIGTDAVANAITIGTTTASSALALNDDNWNITGAGAANFVSVGAATAGTGAFTTLTSNNTTTIGNGSGITTTIGNSGGAATINITSGTGAQTFASSVATGTTTTSAFVFNGSALTSGTALYLTSTATSGILANLNATNTSGTIVNLAYGAAATQGAGALTGLSLNLNTNVTVPAAGQDVTGIVLQLPTASTTSNAAVYSGLNLSTAGAITNGTAGSFAWRGANIVLPVITQSAAGSVTASGVRVLVPASGAIVTAGTMNAIDVIAPTTTGPAAGTLVGVNIGALTSAGAATEYAIQIGAGWDRGITLGANSIVGTTGIIDYTNFDVDANGNITVQAGQGIDANAAGILAVGNVTATTVNIGNTAATTLALGAGGALARTINIGTGTGADAINIGTGATGADTITIGTSASTTSLAFTSGTGPQTFTSNVISGTTTTSGFVFLNTNLTTGTLIYGTSANLTSGILENLTLTGSSAVATAANSGSLFTLTSTTTGFTGATQRLAGIFSSGANTNAAVTVTGQAISVTNTNATSGTNVALTLAASGATTANNAIDITAGLLKQSDATASTSTTTGAAIITGGLGVGGAIYGGAKVVINAAGPFMQLVNTNNALSATYDVNPNGTPSGTNVIWTMGTQASVNSWVLNTYDNATNVARITVTNAGITTISSATASTSTTTGALVLSGAGAGLGVGGRINAANVDAIIGANTAQAGTFTNLTLTGGTITASTVANTLVLKTLTASALQITNGTMAYYSIDTTSNINGVTVHNFNAAGVSGAGYSGAQFVLAGFQSVTTTLTGTITVNNMQGLTSAFYIPTLTDASAITVTKASTAYIGGAPLQAGSVQIGTSVALDIDSTINTTGAATKSINAISINSPTKTACTTGACTWTGLAVADPGSLANTTFYAATFAGGNVGIGTTAPAGLLHVSSDTAATGLSFFTQANASADGFDENFRKARGTGASPTVITTADELGVINFTGYGGAAGYITGAAIKGISSGTIADSRVPGFLSFWTGTDAQPSVSTERMRIDNAGNVGIGTTAPIGKLDFGSASKDSQIFIGVNSDPGWAQPALVFWPNTDGNWKEAIWASSTYVGSQPRLSLGTNVYDDGTNHRYIATANAGMVQLENDGGFRVFSAPSGTAGNAITWTERFTILGTTGTAGNVGIGTASPGACCTDGGLLEVRGADVVPATTASGMFQINSNSALGINKGGSIEFGGVYTASTVTAFANIKGAKENATDTNYAGYLAFFTRPAGTVPAERMRIDSAGNVGIGTATPGSMLVVGSSTALTVSSAGLLTVANATDSTSGTTGAINTLGGVGITKALYVGTAISAGAGVTTAANDIILNIAPNYVLAAGNNLYGALAQMNGGRVNTDLAGAFTGWMSAHRGIVSVLAVNNQNWTNTSGARSFDAGFSMTAGSTGTITGATGFYARNAIGSGATLTNQYGVYVEAMNAATNNYAFWNNGALADFVLQGGGALGTNATRGFTWLPTSAGLPNGVPGAAVTGAVAFEYDTTNNKLCAYNAAWKCSGALADVAEWMPAAGAEIGDIVTLTDLPNPTPDPTAPFMLGKSILAYDAKIIGVVSQYAEEAQAANGYKLSADYHAVTLAGRVPVKVSTENGSILVGDSITSSSKAGVGMKSTKAGRVIGIALEAYSSVDPAAVGKIMVFVNPHWQGNDLTITTTPSGMLANIDPAQLKAGLANLGLVVEPNGTLTVDTLRARKVAVQRIEITDQKNGDIYCTWIQDGEWVKVRSLCDTIIIAGSTVPPPSVTFSITTPTPASIPAAVATAPTATTTPTTPDAIVAPAAPALIVSPTTAVSPTAP